MHQRAPRAVRDACCANARCPLCARRWKTTQDAVLLRELHALPDVCEPLSRAEVHRRQERLRTAVQPLRSWIAVYLKICRVAPYGLDLAHVLKTKLGNSCRMHMTPLRKVAVSKHCTRRWRARADTGASEQRPTAERSASPSMLEQSEDAALESPRVLHVPDGDGRCAVGAAGGLDPAALESPQVLHVPDGDEWCAFSAACTLDDAALCLWH